LDRAEILRFAQDDMTGLAGVLAEVFNLAIEVGVRWQSGSRLRCRKFRGLESTAAAGRLRLGFGTAKNLFLVPRQFAVRDVVLDRMGESEFGDSKSRVQ